MQHSSSYGHFSAHTSANQQAAILGLVMTSIEYNVSLEATKVWSGVFGLCKVPSGENQQVIEYGNFI